MANASCGTCGAPLPAGNGACPSCGSVVVAASPVGDATRPLAAGGADGTVPPLAAAPTDLASGTLVGERFRVDGLLGRGGMGVVYRVHDLVDDCDRALKVLALAQGEEREGVERFEREVEILSRIHHPTVPRVHRWGTSGTDRYLVVDLVEGKDLKGLIGERGAWPPDEAAALAATVADALAAAHAVGIIHRDVKPHNIMVAKDGGVRLLDFGVARTLGHDLRTITRSGIVVGTPAYMSPEQLQGHRLDERTDLYSLGVVLFELLTGRLPFEGTSPLAVAMKHVSELPPRPRTFRSAVPSWLEEVVLRCLEKDPSRRFGSAAELATALRGGAAAGPAIGVGDAVDVVPSIEAPPQWSLAMAMPAGPVAAVVAHPVVVAIGAAAGWAQPLDLLRQRVGKPAPPEFLVVGPEGAAAEPALPSAARRLRLPGPVPPEGPVPPGGDAGSRLGRALNDLFGDLRRSAAGRPLRLLLMADLRDAGLADVAPTLLRRARELAFENAHPLSAALLLAVDDAAEAGVEESALLAALEGDDGRGAPRPLVASVVLVPAAAPVDDAALVALGMLLEPDPENPGSTLGRPHLYRWARSTRLALDSAELARRGAQRLAAQLREALAAPPPERPEEFFPGFAAAFTARLGLGKAVLAPALSPEALVAMQPADPIGTKLPSRVSSDVDFHVKKIQLDRKMAAAKVAELDGRVEALADDFLEKAVAGGGKVAERIAAGLLHAALRGEIAGGELDTAVRSLRAWAADQFAETRLLELVSRVDELEKHQKSQTAHLWEVVERASRAEAGTAEPDHARHLARLLSVANEELRTRRAIAAARYSHEVLGRFSKAVREALKSLSALGHVVAALPASPPPWGDDAAGGIAPDAELQGRLDRSLAALVRTAVEANRRSTSPESKGGREAIGSSLGTFLDYPELGVAGVEALCAKGAGAVLREALPSTSLLARVPGLAARWRTVPAAAPVAIDPSRMCPPVPPAPPLVLAAEAVRQQLEGDGGEARHLAIPDPNAAFRVEWSSPFPAAALRRYASLLGSSAALPLPLFERTRQRLLELAWSTEDPSPMLAFAAHLGRLAEALAAGRDLPSLLEADALAAAFPPLGEERGRDPFAPLEPLVLLAAAPEAATIRERLVPLVSGAQALPPSECDLADLLRGLGELAREADPRRVAEGLSAARALAARTLLEATARPVDGLLGLLARRVVAG